MQMGKPKQEIALFVNVTVKCRAVHKSGYSESKFQVDAEIIMINKKTVYESNTTVCVEVVS